MTTNGGGKIHPAQDLLPTGDRTKEPLVEYWRLFYLAVEVWVGSTPIAALNVMWVWCPHGTPLVVA